MHARAPSKHTHTHTHTHTYIHTYTYARTFLSIYMRLEFFYKYYKKPVIHVHDMSTR